MKQELALGQETFENVEDSFSAAHHDTITKFDIEQYTPCTPKTMTFQYLSSHDINEGPSKRG